MSDQSFNDSPAQPLDTAHMTHDKAIELLSELLHDPQHALDPDQKQAVNMGILALMSERLCLFRWDLR